MEHVLDPASLHVNGFSSGVSRAGEGTSSELKSATTVSGAWSPLSPCASGTWSLVAVGTSLSGDTLSTLGLRVEVLVDASCAWLSSVGVQELVGANALSSSLDTVLALSVSTVGARFAAGAIEVGETLSAVLLLVETWGWAVASTVSEDSTIASTGSTVGALLAVSSTVSWSAIVAPSSGELLVTFALSVDGATSLVAVERLA